MILQFQHLRGITTKVSSYVGLPGEITVDLTTKQLCLHDGGTVGGIRVAKDEVATASSRGLMSAADKANLDNLVSQMATLVTQMETLSDKVNTLLAKMDTYYTGYTGYPRS